MISLLSVAQAQERLLASFSALETEYIPLTAVVGRVLSEAVYSAFDLPPFANSGMDGFAVRAADVQQASKEEGVHLLVAGDIPAGTAPDITLRSGQAARIMTGAPLPAGADAIVPVEETDFDYRQAGLAAPQSVQVYRSVKPGEYVRPRGQDMQAGEMALPAGTRLRPQEIGFLAMLGISSVPTHRRPRVAVFSSGDELVPVDLPLEPGKIHDSNTYTLISLVEKYGGICLNLGIVPDQIKAVRAGLDVAANQSVDLILTSAGVSVGAFDFVRRVVEQGGELDFWRVNMRPGKPLAFGAYKGIPFIGLPGNPVSSFVGFEVFVRQVLQKMTGLSHLPRRVVRARLQESVESDGRESYLRAELIEQDGAWLARLSGHQGSGNLRSLVQANALLLVPSGVKSLPVGAEVETWFLE
jgi:molybdopterin molybdotransferase